MATTIHMDVEKLKEALAILNNIPSDLEPGGNASIGDLRDCENIATYLSRFGNGGNANSWISSHANDLYVEINAHVTELKAACAEIGARLQSSITSYTGSDDSSSKTVKKTDPSNLSGR